MQPVPAVPPAAIEVIESRADQSRDAAVCTRAFEEMRRHPVCDVVINYTPDGGCFLSGGPPGYPRKPQPDWAVKQYKTQVRACFSD